MFTYFGEIVVQNNSDMELRATIAIASFVQRVDGMKSYCLKSKYCSQFAHSKQLYRDRDKLMREPRQSKIENYKRILEHQ